MSTSERLQVFGLLALILSNTLVPAKETTWKHVASMAWALVAIGYFVASFLV